MDDAAVSLDFECPAPMERVWAALTDPTALSRWMFFETEDFRPAVGCRFHFRPKPEIGWPAVVEGEVLEVQTPHRLVYTWEVAQLGHATRVTWTLTPLDGGRTRLQLEQRGFAPEATQELDGARYGWSAQLGQLQQILGLA
ncbi:MAG: SRPBCC domain-containing protein [Firmicutes bacterium]|nr:SRPBCC domain-containing protein [Alicyclobacillaceae bacterium]MCL6498358.1 SRPBCC domain-containing protein [Bacillota bacterium]